MSGEELRSSIEVDSFVRDGGRVFLRGHFRGVPVELRGMHRGECVCPGCGGTLEWIEAAPTARDYVIHHRSRSGCAWFVVATTAETLRLVQSVLAAEKGERL